MVARGNQWYPRTNIDAHLKFLEYQPPIMGIRPQNITNLKFPIIFH